MTEAAPFAFEIEDFGGLQRRAPGEIYWRRGRLRRAARFYAHLRRDPLPFLLDEIRDHVNYHGPTPPLAKAQLIDSVDNPNFVD